MAAKAHNVFKYLRQTANFAEAVTTSSHSGLPSADAWQGRSENTSQPVVTLNPSAATFRPQASWEAAPLRSTQGLPLPQLSPAQAPFQRYIDQLRLSPGDGNSPQHVLANPRGRPAITPTVLTGPLGVDLGPLLFGSTAQNFRGALPKHQDLLLPPAATVARASVSSEPVISSRLDLAATAAACSQPDTPGCPTAAGCNSNKPSFVPPPPPKAQVTAPEDQMQRQQNLAGGQLSRIQARISPRSFPQQQQQLSHLPPARRQRASSSSVNLNKEIMAARTTAELLALVRDKGPHMDFFNISSAISRTPKLAGLLGNDTTGGLAPGQHQPLDPDSRELAACLAQLMGDKIALFDARGLANSAWAFGKLRYIPNPALPSLIAKQAIAKIDGFGAQNISNLVWAFVYMHHRDEAVLSLVAEKVCSKLDEFKPQELANVLWAFASLEFHDPEMVRLTTQRAARIASQFKEQELSNAIWAMGRLQHHDPATFTALLAEARSKLHHFLPQGISNVAWAMASLGHKDIGLLKMMVAQCMQHLAAFDVQALSNLAWAFASLGVYDAAFMDQLVTEATQRLDRLGPQNLASILWACAALGHRDARMLSAWNSQVVARLPLLEPQAIASLASSFVKLGHADKALFEALAAAVMSKPEGWSAHSLANTAWAFAGSGHHHAALMDEVACRLLCSLDTCSPQDCSMALWSYATLGHSSPELFDGMLAKLASNLELVQPQCLASALWACARMGHSPGPFGLLLARQAVGFMSTFGAEELCDTAWALAKMELLDTPTFNTFTACLEQAASKGHVSVHQIQQAVEAQRMLHAKLQREAGSAAGVAAPQLPEPLLAAARKQPGTTGPSVGSTVHAVQHPSFSKAAVSGQSQADARSSTVLGSQPAKTEGLFHVGAGMQQQAGVPGIPPSQMRSAFAAMEPFGPVSPSSASSSPLVAAVGVPPRAATAATSFNMAALDDILSLPGWSMSLSAGEEDAGARAAVARQLPVYPATIEQSRSYQTASPFVSGLSMPAPIPQSSGWASVAGLDGIAGIKLGSFLQQQHQQQQQLASALSTMSSLDEQETVGHFLPRELFDAIDVHHGSNHAG